MITRVDVELVVAVFVLFGGGTAGLMVVSGWVERWARRRRGS